MKVIDYAYKNTRTVAVTKKQTILSALDALIAGFVTVMFTVLILAVLFIIFG